MNETVVLLQNWQFNLLIGVMTALALAALCGLVYARMQARRLALARARNETLEQAYRLTWHALSKDALLDLVRKEISQCQTETSASDVCMTPVLHAFRRLEDESGHELKSIRYDLVRITDLSRATPGVCGDFSRLADTSCEPYRSMTGRLQQVWAYNPISNEAVANATRIELKTIRHLAHAARVDVAGATAAIAHLARASTAAGTSVTTALARDKLDEAALALSKGDYHLVSDLCGEVTAEIAKAMSALEAARPAPQNAI